MWLISAVATQSISVLGTLIAARVPAHQDTILFVSLAFFLMGCMLYLNIIAIIFFRLTFVPLAPAEMTPPYWINMGATAITTQAGASLMLQSGKSQILTRTAAVSQRLHAVLLGGGNLVDSTAHHPGRVDLSGPARADDLRPAILGRGISARNVHGEHPSTRESRRGSTFSTLFPRYRSIWPWSHGR